MPLQPIQVLQFWPTARTGQPLSLDFQLHRLVEHGQVTDAPERLVVDGHDPLAAATAASAAA
jgi:hypothetical protein